MTGPGASASLCVMKTSHLTVLLLALACMASAAAAAPASKSAGSKPAAKSPAPRFTVPFIADDYTRAVAEARARKVPLFIEAWAPW